MSKGPWISSFMDDMFGTIAGMNFPVNTGSIDFIPTDGAGHTLSIKGDKVRWMGLRSRSQQKKAYEFCFTVSSVIDRLAEYDLTGKLEIFRIAKKGKNKPLTSPWADKMRTLLEQPNHLQGWYQFRGQQTAYKKTHGWCLVLPIIPAGFSDPSDATALLNIPPWCVEPISNRVFISGRLETVLKGWRLNILGKQTILAPDQVFLLQDGFQQDESRDFLVPLSKLVGLDMAVSNICKAMEADQVLLTKKGPLGFITHDASAVKDSQVGYIPMSKQQKNDLQRDLQRYGLSLAQYQYVISRTAAKWIPMSFNVKDLQTKETVDQCEQIICRRYGFPYILFKETDATYANGDNAAATVYQTNVIPNADRDMAEYNKFFKAKENNGTLDIDFCHVAALQEDEEMKATALKTNNEAWEVLWLNNGCTLNEWREAIGMEPIAEGEIFYADSQAANMTIDIPVQTVDSTMKPKQKNKKPKQIAK